MRQILSSITRPKFSNYLTTDNNHRIDLFLFLCQVPETYCFSLNHAFVTKVFPIVTDIGAVAERVRAAQFGMVIPTHLDASDINDVIIESFLGSSRQPHATPSRSEMTPERMVVVK